MSRIRHSAKGRHLSKYQPDHFIASYSQQLTSRHNGLWCSPITRMFSNSVFVEYIYKSADECISRDLCRTQPAVGGRENVDGNCLNYSYLIQHSTIFHTTQPYPFLSTLNSCPFKPNTTLPLPFNPTLPLPLSPTLPLSLNPTLPPSNQPHPTPYLTT
jgi:hypothetical protein